MAKGGKHLNTQSKSKKTNKSSKSYKSDYTKYNDYNGKHLSVKTYSNTYSRSRHKSRKKFRLSAVAPFTAIMIVFCLLMISPLKGCILTDGDYIGIAAAQSVALEDSGIPSTAAKAMSADMIMIDGDVYYKVQFTGSVTDYRYIIDAESGDIVMQNFYRLDNGD